MFKAKACLLLCLLLALICCGCEEQYINQDQDLIDLQVYQPETVYIGVVLPEGGNDEINKAAFQVAADIINQSHDLDWNMASKAGISGYGQARIEFVWTGNGQTPAALSTNTDELLSLGVVALVGNGSTSYTSAAIQQAVDYQIPMVCGTALGDWLIDGSTYDFQGWFSRIGPSLDMESDALFSYLKRCNQTQNAGLETVGIIYEDSAYGKEVLESFNSYAESYDFQVVARLSCDPNSTNLANEVQRMVSAAPDVIVCSANTDSTLRLISGVHDSLYNPELLFCYGEAFQSPLVSRYTQDRGIDYVCGVITTPPLETQLASGNFTADSDNSSNITDITGTEAEEDDATAATNELYEYINDMYMARTGQNMDDRALMDFSSVILIAQAIGELGTSLPEQVGPYLHETGFDSPYLVSPTISLDDSGQNTAMCGYVSLIQDGKYYQAL